MNRYNYACVFIAAVISRELYRVTSFFDEFCSSQLSTILSLHSIAVDLALISDSEQC